MQNYFSVQNLQKNKRAQRVYKVRQHSIYRPPTHDRQTLAVLLRTILQYVRAP